MSHTVLLTFLLACGWLAEPDAAAHAKLVDAWMKICTAHATDYRIQYAGEPDKKIRLHKQPVFRHAQLVRGGRDIGAVWVWIDDDDRPAAIGTVFCYEAGQGYRWMAHEFHSLADKPLKATWRNRILWAPAEAGLQWKPIAEAPPPADSPARRLRQIRQLAGRFSAHSIAHSGSRWELRLIPKPVYRYQHRDGNVTLDGALLALCQGTDPEIFLGIEVRAGENGRKWHYACAAFSDYDLHVRLDGSEVWAPGRGQANSRNAAHWWNGNIERTRLPEGDEASEEEQELTSQRSDRASAELGVGH
jgi:hypothetical protein